MGLNLSNRDARLEVMRGNLDKKAVALKPVEAPPPVAQPAPPPVIQPSVTVDTSPIAAVLSHGFEMMARREDPIVQAPVSAPTKWKFKITERDRMGNIISFEAVAQ